MFNISLVQNKYSVVGIYNCDCNYLILQHDKNASTAIDRDFVVFFLNG